MLRPLFYCMQNATGINWQIMAKQKPKQGLQQVSGFSLQQMYVTNCMLLSNK